VRLAPFSFRRLAIITRNLVSPARRRTGIIRRPSGASPRAGFGRQIELGAEAGNIRVKFGVAGAERLDFLHRTFNRFRLRKNEADKHFLIKRIERFMIHSKLESVPDSAVKFPPPRQKIWSTPAKLHVEG
jgi:hypothetical protein